MSKSLIPSNMYSCILLHVLPTKICSVNDKKYTTQDIPQRKHTFKCLTMFWDWYSLLIKFDDHLLENL